MALDDFGRRREDWVIEDSPLLLAIVMPDLRLQNFNRTWETLLGYPRNLLLGKQFTRIIDPSEQAAALALINTRDTRRIEFSLRCSDGTYRCFEWEHRQAREGEGAFVRGLDITERKKMETTQNLRRYMQQRKAERSSS